MSWIDAGAVAALEEQTSIGADLDGEPVRVVRCDGEILAVADVCTHDGAPLDDAEVEACQIICPRHGARFCLRTGEALTPPAYEPLRTYAVRIDAGRILIERPD
jgi:3-phenylpropionate/trans-cinnamate dioxygenase ferredoxin subunit